MKRLFVVDADTEFQNQVKGLVDPEEVELILVDKGSEAIQTASQKSPDAIFLSLELKDVNGFLVCSSLKKNPQTKDIPVLITSSTRSEEDFEQHRKLKFRADGYYRKPIEAETLNTILVDLLGAAALKEGNTNPLASEFTEENIDRLLDSTFMGGEAEASVSGEGAVADEPALPEEPESAPEAPVETEEKGKPVTDEFSFSVDDLEDDDEPTAATKPEKKAAQNGEIHTVADAADVVEPLKQALREKEAQTIQLEKENEFLTSENRNLLMNITSLKADIEEKVASEQEKNAELVRQVAELEERISELQTLNTETGNQLSEATEERDNALAEKQTLTEAKDRLAEQLESLKSAHEQQVEELEGRIRSLNETQQTIQSERDAAVSEKDGLENRLQEQTREFEEKESMLMSTIENLTKNTRELEDQLKSYKDRIQQLKSILGGLENSTDGPGA